MCMVCGHTCMHVSMCASMLAYVSGWHIYGIWRMGELGPQLNENDHKLPAQKTWGWCVGVSLYKGLACWLVSPECPLRYEIKSDMFLGWVDYQLSSYRDLLFSSSPLPKDVIAGHTKDLPIAGLTTADIQGPTPAYGLTSFVWLQAGEAGETLNGRAEASWGMQSWTTSWATTDQGMAKKFTRSTDQQSQEGPFKSDNEFGLRVSLGQCDNDPGNWWAITIKELPGCPQVLLWGPTLQWCAKSVCVQDMDNCPVGCLQSNAPKKGRHSPGLTLKLLYFWLASSNGAHGRNAVSSLLKKNLFCCSQVFYCYGYH